MENNNNNNTESTMCLTGCGFHGNPATEGLCSVCYKESIKNKPKEVSGKNVVKQHKATVSTNSSPKSSLSSEKVMATLTMTKECKKIAVENKVNVACATSVVTSVGESVAIQEGGEEPKRKSKRCNEATCRRKLGLTSIQCRCGGTFCGIHRYSNEHNCSFDYRHMGAEQISKNNVKLVKEKIQKI